MAYKNHSITETKKNKTKMNVSVCFLHEIQSLLFFLYSFFLVLGINRRRGIVKIGSSRVLHV